MPERIEVDGVAEVDTWAVLSGVKDDDDTGETELPAGIIIIIIDGSIEDSDEFDIERGREEFGYPPSAVAKVLLLLMSVDILEDKADSPPPLQLVTPPPRAC